MISKMLHAIFGSPTAAEGQRKFAQCTYTISLLAVFVIGCVVAMAFVNPAVGGVLKEVALAAIPAIVTVFGLTIGGNGLEHVAKQFGGKAEKPQS